MNTHWIVLLVIGLAAHLAAAQTYTVPDEGGAAHKCMYRLRLTDGGSVEGVAFSNDGKTLYLRTDGRAINIWEILVYYWPEVLGGLSFLVAVPCILLLWRVRRRPRIVGEPHCRKCNYCVRGIESGICPECGRPIRRPIVGRPLWRRVMIPATLLAVVVVGYGGLWALRVPRSGPASNWLNWWSYGLEEAAKKRGYSLSTWVRPVARILDVDLQSGRTRRTLITRPAALRCWLGLVSVPSGGLLTTFGNDLALVDTRSGRIRRKLPGPAGGSTRAGCWRQVAGFGADGNGAYLVQADSAAKATRLLKWDLRTGAETELLSTGLDAVTYNGRTGQWPRRFFHVPGSDPPQFLELPSSMATGDDMRGEKPSTIRLHEFGAQHRVLGEFAAAVWGYESPTFCSSGRAVYLKTRGFAESGLACYELPTGKRIGQISGAFNFAGVGSDCDASLTRIVTEGSWMLLSDNPFAAMLTGGGVHGFLVADLRSGTWIGRFPRPADGLYHGVYMSPDGRYFAATGFLRERDPSGAYQDELIVYGLSSLPHEEMAKDAQKEIELRKAMEQVQARESPKLPWPFGPAAPDSTQPATDSRELPQGGSGG